MFRGAALRLAVGLSALAHCAAVGDAQTSEAPGSLPPLCIHAPAEFLQGAAAAGSSKLRSWQKLGDAAIVLEYESVYDVHSPADPELPLRAQPGSFFAGTILQDLECLVDPTLYDFVLIYSIQEVPGWIHAGPRGVRTPAKNIGLLNTEFGLPSAFPAWPRLLLAPHMNSVEFIAQDGSVDFGSRAAAHEMGHAWSVFWAQESSGPREWHSGDPAAWLAACCSHWSWNWVDDAMPGMMYSAPTQAKFNEFDLYAMGLMPYSEAGVLTYEVYEDPGTGPPGPAHTVGLHDLLFSLSLLGPDYFEGDGRRIPEVDPEAGGRTALIVIVKGAQEAVSAGQHAMVADLAVALPELWFQATGGRSDLDITNGSSGPVDLDLDGVLDCVDNCPATPNPAQADLDGDALGDDCDPCPHVPDPNFWDLDHLGGFNLHDVQIFQNCFSGSQPMTPACAVADFGGGGTIDLMDYVPVAELLGGQCASPPAQLEAPAPGPQ